MGISSVLSIKSAVSFFYNTAETLYLTGEGDILGAFCELQTLSYLPLLYCRQDCVTFDPYLNDSLMYQYGNFLSEGLFEIIYLPVSSTKSQ